MYGISERLSLNINYSKSLQKDCIANTKAVDNIKLPLALEPVS